MVLPPARKMACLNSDGSRFESMDLEAQGSKPLVGQNKKRACLSLPVLLGALGLLFGTVALIVAGVFASRTSQTPSPGLNNAVVFVRDPRHVPEGFVLGPSLTQGTGYYARLQPMVYSRSDHKVGSQQIDHGLYEACFFSFLPYVIHLKPALRCRLYLWGTAYTS